MNPSKSISVSGMGCVTCLGANTDALWNGALTNHIGILDGFGKIPAALIETLRVKNNLKDRASKSLILSLASAREAMAQAGWSSLNSDDGLIIATTTGQIDLWESQMIEFAKNKISTQEFAAPLKNQSLSSVLESLTEELNFKGKSLLLTSACSASTQAIALGRLWIQQEKIKRCLVGGVEILSRLIIDGFRSLQLLNPDPATPFDKNRRGINLSEGAAFLCLEREPKNKLALISGSGMSSDAFHMTSPHPEGRGSYVAMKQALDSANLSPNQIDWIHAHGTGSMANDQSEGQAIKALFQDLTPWVSSTKGIHGHALAASGAVESILCIMALKNNKILKTTGLVNPDESIPVNHPTENMNFELKNIMKNTLGFGGSNATLILSHPNTEGVR